MSAEAGDYIPEGKCRETDIAQAYMMQQEQRKVLAQFLSSQLSK